MLLKPDEALEIHFLKRRIQYLNHPYRNQRFGSDEMSVCLVSENFRDVKSKKDFLDSLETMADYPDRFNQSEEEE